jgi:hypothetical protein
MKTHPIVPAILRADVRNPMPRIGCLLHIVSNGERACHPANSVRILSYRS